MPRDDAVQDDPFARAVARADAAEKAETAARSAKRSEQWSSMNRTGFRTHATVFVAVNLLIFAIWATTALLLGGTTYPWFLWPLLGWGVGMAAHYAAARPHLGRDTRATTPAGSTTAELARLSELHASGALSDEEFRAAKASLLGTG